MRKFWCMVLSAALLFTMFVFPTVEAESGMESGIIFDDNFEDGSIPEGWNISLNGANGAEVVEKTGMDGQTSKVLKLTKDLSTNAVSAERTIADVPDGASGKLLVSYKLKVESEGKKSNNGWFFGEIYCNNTANSPWFWIPFPYMDGNMDAFRVYSDGNEYFSYAANKAGGVYDGVLIQPIMNDWKEVATLIDFDTQTVTYYINGKLYGTATHKDGTATATSGQKLSFTIDGEPTLATASVDYYFDDVRAERPSALTVSSEMEDAQQVSPSTPVTLHFSHPVDRDTLLRNITVTCHSAAVDGVDAVISNNGKTAAILLGTMQDNAEYEITVAPSMTDVYGLPLADSYAMRFTTGVWDGVIFDDNFEDGGIPAGWNISLHGANGAEVVDKIGMDGQTSKMLRLTKDTTKNNLEAIRTISNSQNATRSKLLVSYKLKVEAETELEKKNSNDGWLFGTIWYANSKGKPNFWSPFPYMDGAIDGFLVRTDGAEYNYTPAAGKLDSVLIWPIVNDWKEITTITDFSAQTITYYVNGELYGTAAHKTDVEDPSEALYAQQLYFAVGSNIGPDPGVPYPVSYYFDDVRAELLSNLSVETNLTEQVFDPLSSIALDFSDAVSRDALMRALTLEDPNGEVNGIMLDLSSDGKHAQLSLPNGFSGDTQYTLRISRALSSRGYRSLAEDYVVQFITDEREETPDMKMPHILDIVNDTFEGSQEIPAEWAFTFNDTAVNSADIITAAGADGRQTNVLRVTKGCVDGRVSDMQFVRWFQDVENAGRIVASYEFNMAQPPKVKQANSGWPFGGVGLNSMENWQAFVYMDHLPNLFTIREIDGVTTTHYGTYQAVVSESGWHSVQYIFDLDANYEEVYIDGAKLATAKYEKPCSLATSIMWGIANGYQTDAPIVYYFDNIKVQRVPKLCASMAVMESNVNPEEPVVLKLSAPVESTALKNALTLKKNGASVPYSLKLDPAGTSAEISPLEGWRYGKIPYTVEVSDLLADIYGEKITQPYTYTFTTMLTDGIRLSEKTEVSYDGSSLDAAHTITASLTLCNPETRSRPVVLGVAAYDTNNCMTGFSMLDLGTVAADSERSLSVKMEAVKPGTASLKAFLWQGASDFPAYHLPIVYGTPAAQINAAAVGDGLLSFVETAVDSPANMIVRGCADTENDLLTLLVVRGDVKESELSAKIKDIVFVDTFRSSGDKSYQYGFQMPDEYGQFSIFACNGTRVQKRIIRYLQPEAITQLLQNINSYSDVQLLDVLKGNQASLADISVFSDARDEGILIQLVRQNAEKIAADGVPELRKAVTAAKEMVALLNTIRDAKIWNTVEAVLRKNAAAFRLDMSAFGYLSAEGRQQVCCGLMGHVYSGADALRKEFDTLVAANAPSKKNGSGGGGGGGGGSGSAHSYDPGFSDYVAPAPVAALELPPIFADLEQAQWAEDAIAALYEKGIVNGDGDGRFYPLRSVTRAEFAKMTVLAFGIPEAAGQDGFLDVDADHWAYPYILAAKEAGIVSGREDGTFGADMPVTRQDTAVILHRAAAWAGQKFTEEAGNFSDADSIADYARDAVSALAGAGIINGMEDGSFAPRQAATRAQTAKLLYELLKEGE